MSDFVNILYNNKKKKYTVLNDIISIEECVDRTVNIFFDSHLLFDQFRIKYYENMTKTIIDERLVNEMVAEFFNLVGHYRHYFNQKVGSYVRFFLIHGHDDAYKTLLYPDWNSHFIEKQNHEISIKFIDKVVKRCATFSQVLLDIHVISAPNKNIDRLTLPYILNEQSKVCIEGSPVNLFCTSDAVALLYANILPNCKFLIGDCIYHKGSIGKYLGKDYSSCNFISPSAMLPILAFRGNYSVPLIHGEIKQRAILSLFEQKDDNSVITPDFYKDIDLLTNLLMERQKKCKKIQLDEEVIRLEIEKRIDFFDIPTNANNQVINESDRIALFEQYTSNVEEEDLAFEYNAKLFNNRINLSVLV